MQAGVVGEELEDGAVGRGDVVRVARQCDPPEWAAPLAELRPDERWDEARVVEGIGDARLLGLGAQVVPVVEDDGAGSPEVEHRPDVGGHGATRSALVLVGEGGSQLQRVREGHLVGHVAAQRVVGGRLIRDQVERLPGGRPGRFDLRGVTDQRDADRLTSRRRIAGQA